MLRLGGIHTEFHQNPSTGSRVEACGLTHTVNNSVCDHFVQMTPFFFFSGVRLTSPGTAATSGLLYSPK
jgi:hypothetical protein